MLAYGLVRRRLQHCLRAQGEQSLAAHDVGQPELASQGSRRRLRPPPHEADNLDALELALPRAFEDQASNSAAAENRDTHHRGSIIDRITEGAKCESLF